MRVALEALGVTDNSLKDPERESLDAAGYVVLADVFPPDQLERLRQSFDHAVAEQLPALGQKETGTRHIKDLESKEIFWRVPLQPRILAAVFHILNRRFVCSIPHGREPLQGFGQQGLHMDWRSGGNGTVYHVATAICLLDDFTGDNGATRVVPGSHRNAKSPDKRVADPAFFHSKQITITAGAGAVLLFNGHLLHSGTRNHSGLRRRTLQFSFTAHEMRIWFATDEHRPHISDPIARYIFGYDANPAGLSVFDSDQKLQIT